MKFRSTRQFAILVAGVALLQTSCMTTKPIKKTKPAEAQTIQEKDGSKSPEETAPATASVPPVMPAPQAVNLPAVSQSEQLLEFVLRHTNEANPWTIDDDQYYSTLATPQTPRSLGEAALTLGAVKKTLNPATPAKSSFVESDLTKPAGSVQNPQANPQANSPANPQANPQTQEPTLEALCLEKKINLAEAVEKNPFLQSYDVVHMVSTALTKNGGSPDFRTKTAAVIQEQAEKWVALRPEQKPAKPVIPPLVAAPGYQANQPATSSPTPAPVVPQGVLGTVSDPKAAESLMNEAQALADQGKFHDAVQKLQQLTPDNPQYGAAHEKAKTISNKAVQELRRKAAKSYQDSLPVSDPKLRASYLKEAKNYLEEAMTNYPEADLLATVQENLNMINKDLDKIH